MKQGSGAIRMGIACALLFASLSLVVWRQSRALEEQRALDALAHERVLLQAERSQLQREIQGLESRTRVVTAAARYGLRGPTGAEIVFLREPSLAREEGPAAAGRARLAAGERGR
jgi:cell division protein FtsB